MYTCTFYCLLENNDGKSFRRSSKSYDKKKETDEDDREDEELDWSHPVCTYFRLRGEFRENKVSPISDFLPIFTKLDFF